MGGPEMAPQTPQRSERPGEPGPLLDHPNPQTPQRSERPGEPGPLLDDRDSFTSSGPPPQSRAAVRHGGHDVVGAALEGARDTAVGLAAVLRRLHLVARQLAVGDDADRAGDTHPIRALALFDAHHGRVRLQLRHEIPEKRVGVHRLLLRSSESGRRTATRVPPSVARALMIALGTLLLVAGAAAAAPVSEQTVHDVASQLRCVVCQNLSVADSPSEMAAQMRAIVRERLEAGETPEQVREYFVARYGEWILLAPRRTGFNLIVWGFPVAAIAVGFGVVALLLRRWTRRRRAAPAPPPVDAAMSERIRRELETDR